VRKSRVLVPALVLAALALLPAAVRAQEDGYRFRLANFSLELLGGLARINPTDFNMLASAEEAYLQYNYVTRFNYYRNLYGDAYKVTSTRTGDARFVPMTSADLAGIRLRYDLSPSLGLSIGLQVLDRRQYSRVGMTVDVSDQGRDYIDYNGPRGYGYQNSGFLLGVRAWFPQLGAHFGWQFGPTFRIEAHVDGGPFFVSCRAATERRTSTTDASGYVSGTLSALDMQGTSKGFAGELGARLNIKAGGWLDLFVEGAFTFRDGVDLKGPTTSRTIPYDSNAAQDPAVSTWSGPWAIASTTTTAAWGTLASSVPQNKLWFTSFSNSGMMKFAFSLSGFQMTAGLAIHFGRPAPVQE